MRKQFALTTILLLAWGMTSVRAQIGSPAGGPMADVMAKVFGTNLNFSATMEVQAKMLPKNDDILMSGKIYFANGNSRTEMDMTSMKGGKITPQTVAQLKAMGMDQMVSISHPAEKIVYLIYPGLHAYAKMEMPDVKTNDFKVERTELGAETLDGHPCVKIKCTVTNGKTGQRLTMISWNATDLKNCPIKIEQSAWTGSDSYEGSTTSMHFTDINPATPGADLFEPPAGFKAYDNMQTMMQTEVMKKMSGGMGAPAAN